MRPLAAALSVVHVHQVFAHGIVQRGGSEMRIGQLVRFGAGPKPHFGDVESHDVAAGG